MRSWPADRGQRQDPRIPILCVVNVFLAFYHRDLKPAARPAASMLHVARQIAAELYARIPKGAPAAPT
jgi:hypothetical protein